MGRGLSNGEIAGTLVISEVTVKSHIGRIFTKLDLRDRAAAIVYAFDRGLVAPGRRGLVPPVGTTYDSTAQMSWSRKLKVSAKRKERRLPSCRRSLPRRRSRRSPCLLDGAPQREPREARPSGPSMSASNCC